MRTRPTPTATIALIAFTLIASVTTATTATAQPSRDLELTGTHLDGTYPFGMPKLIWDNIGAPLYTITRREAVKGAKPIDVAWTQDRIWLIGQVHDSSLNPEQGKTYIYRVKKYGGGWQTRPVKFTIPEGPSVEERTDSYDRPLRLTDEGKVKIRWSHYHNNSLKPVTKYKFVRRIKDANTQNNPQALYIFDITISDEFIQYLKSQKSPYTLEHIDQTVKPGTTYQYRRIEYNDKTDNNGNKIGYTKISNGWGRWQTITTPPQQGCNDSDCDKQALLDFKNNLPPNKQNQHPFANWTKTTPLSLFQDESDNDFIDLDNNGRVTNLNLHSNDLTELPAEIGKLTNLELLALWGNDFVSLPSEIGNLTNLEFLSLGRNDLVSLPSEIGNLTNLEELYLFQNDLTSLPTSIGNLTNLTILYLHTNDLTELPSSFVNLTNLTTLYLGDNDFASCPPPNVPSHITDCNTQN